MGIQIEKARCFRITLFENCRASRKEKKSKTLTPPHPPKKIKKKNKNYINLRLFLAIGFLHGSNEQNMLSKTIDGEPGNYNFICSHIVLS